MCKIYRLGPTLAVASGLQPLYALSPVASFPTRFSNFRQTPSLLYMIPITPPAQDHNGSTISVYAQLVSGGEEC